MTRLISLSRAGLFLFCTLALLSASAVADDLIVGVGAWGDWGTYVIDPNTGVTTQKTYETGWAMGASSSPYPQSIFVLGTIALGRFDMNSRQWQGLGYLPFTSWDLAFDRNAGVLYGVGYDGGVVSIDYGSCSMSCTETFVGSFQGDVRAIDFVRGFGIFGADINGSLWLFDPANGNVTNVGETGILGISDLAYDVAGKKLIASAGSPKCGGGCGPASGTIWSIDPLNGHSVLLNANAPEIWGLAEVTPEPSSAVLLLSGFGLLAGAARRRLG